MIDSVERSIRLTHLIAQAHPDPGVRLDRLVVNAARRVSRDLIADGFLVPSNFPPPQHPMTASGIPIVKRKI